MSDELDIAAAIIPVAAAFHTVVVVTIDDTCYKSCEPQIESFLGL
jgi:hypothetical protein